MCAPKPHAIQTFMAYEPSEDSKSLATAEAGSVCLREFADMHLKQRLFGTASTDHKEFMDEFASLSGRRPEQWLLWIIQIDEFQATPNRAAGLVPSLSAARSRSPRHS